MNDRVAPSQPQSGLGSTHGTAAISSAHLLRSRISRVCVAIAASTPEELSHKAFEAARENPFLEFRLDYLPNPADGIPKIRRFLHDLGEVTAIATCRRSPNGGKFKGSIHAELEILQKAVEAGCDLIDIEIETVEELKPAELERMRSLGAALIISYHDFKATGDLDKVFERIQKFRPDYMKVVSTATCLADNVKMMRFLERTSDQANMIGICMGEQGLISRVLGVRAGSAFTFASASAGEETGPGQVSARMLHEIYRIDEVSSATKVYGVIGNPVTHSLSPLIHNLAFRRETVNAVFLALQATEMEDVLTLVREIPLHGMAVTMPFKGEILKHLANTDNLSQQIGACNTVVRALDGKLYGFNTDVAAILRPLERRLPLRGARVLVIGAGGAARAAVFGLKDKGAEVSIVNRTPEAAQKLARQAKAKSIKYEQLAKASFDVILNATPIGMRGNKQQSWLQPDQLNARLVFDMVYNPIETPLLRMAREAGLAVITGVEMFVQQGARQFEIWSGKPAPEEEMLRAVVHSLRQRGETGQEEAGQASVAAATGKAKRLPEKHIPAGKPAVPKHVDTKQSAPKHAEPKHVASHVKNAEAKTETKTSAKAGAAAKSSDKVAAKVPAKVTAKAPVKASTVGHVAAKAAPSKPGTTKAAAKKAVAKSAQSAVKGKQTKPAAKAAKPAVKTAKPAAKAKKAVAKAVKPSAKAAKPLPKAAKTTAKTTAKSARPVARKAAPKKQAAQAKQAAPKKKAAAPAKAAQKKPTSGGKAKRGSTPASRSSHPVRKR